MTTPDRRPRVGAMSRTNVTSTSLAATVVLVHGALTDASVWHDVARRLQAAGHPVHAPALPMRSLDQDAAYLAGFLSHLSGPVVLAGHSWAGSVISHPDIAEVGNVAALVYVAAFQPDTAESAGELNNLFPGSGLTPENLAVVPNALAGNDLTLLPERFAEVYAADLDPADAMVLAFSQRPIDPAALAQTFTGLPTWRSIPSFAVVSTNDRSLPPAVLLHMAERAGSHIVEVASSHAVPLAQPGAVADLIQEAARAAVTSDAALSS
ncbi:pimeloyl-ACP methyl ester carboxylesterase [Catenulispora sp. GP43]|uniref:alpha/beta fold hydrolase n=1 Tax=Catenulispora sp. GP43 TaxID=3156263 RepID=UPI00351784B4